MANSITVSFEMSPETFDEAKKIAKRFGCSTIGDLFKKSMVIMQCIKEQIEDGEYNVTMIAKEECGDRVVEINL